MADEAVALYLATLAEVQRQAAQMNPGRGGEASADSGSDWVVLESQSTPAQLPGEEGCSLWPQQQWAIGYEILVSSAPQLLWLPTALATFNSSLVLCATVLPVSSVHLPTEVPPSRRHAVLCVHR